MISHLNGLWVEDGMTYSYDDFEKGREQVFGLLIPPKNLPHQKILLLGVCGNTVGHLIKADYPDAELTLVDNRPQTPETIKADAFQFIKETKERFNFVIVDLFTNAKVVDLVFSPDFYVELARITDFVLLDLDTTDRRTPDYYNYFISISATTVGNNQVLTLMNKNLYS